MSFPIVIQGTQIDFPSSADAPNWAPAVISFAQAVEAALNSAGVGAFDVPPQVLDISIYNPGTSVNINPLNFPITVVRAAFIRYAVFRTTSSNTAYEVGELEIIYNPNGPSGNLWEVGRQYVGNGLITFYVTDAGQVQFTTSTLAGTGHEGKISFTAQTLTQS